MRARSAAPWVLTIIIAIVLGIFVRWIVGKFLVLLLAGLILFWILGSWGRGGRK